MVVTPWVLAPLVGLAVVGLAFITRVCWDVLSQQWFGSDRRRSR